MIQILLGVVVVSLLGLGVYAAQRGDKVETMGNQAIVEVPQIAAANDSTMMDAVQEDTMKNTATKSNEMTKDEMANAPLADAAMKKDEMMKDGMADTSIVPNAATAPAQYVPYTEAAVATYAERGDVVLFFRASWCPSCRALDSDITKNLGSAPVGLTILDVDYDTAVDLRQKYGVTTQHTLVQVAGDGALIKKWSGGSTLASVVEQVQ